MRDLSFLRNRTPGTVGEAKVHHSAVAIALLPGEAGEEVLFEVRSEKIGHQPGDVCLPGGMVEDGEAPEQAAVREMTEELLIRPEQVELLGAADIFQSVGMQVHPFVCRLSDYGGGFSRDEVAEIFRVPLDFFLQTSPEIHEVNWRVELGDDFPFEKIHGGRKYGWRKRRDHILFYEYDGHVIWGMTAKIIESFAQILRNHSARVR